MGVKYHLALNYEIWGACPLLPPSSFPMQKLLLLQAILTSASSIRDAHVREPLFVHTCSMDAIVLNGIRWVWINEECSIRCSIETCLLSMLNSLFTLARIHNLLNVLVAIIGYLHQ